MSSEVKKRYRLYVNGDFIDGYESRKMAARVGKSVLKALPVNDNRWEVIDGWNKDEVENHV